MSKAIVRNGELLYGCPACLPDPFVRGIHRIPVEGDRKWQFNGDRNAPTLSPSVKSGHDGPGGDDPWVHVCHHFLRGGRIEYCGDCTHGMGGQTAEMLPVELVGEYGLARVVGDDCEGA